jgi:transposase-like protein
MDKRKRIYTDEFKRSALERLQQTGKTGAEVARELGIGPGELNRWRRAAEKEKNGEGIPFPGKGSPATKNLIDYSERIEISKRRMKY